MLDIITFVVEQSILYLPLIIGAYVSIALMRLPNLCLETAFVTGAVFAQAMVHYAPMMPKGLLLVAVCSASLLGGLAVGLCKALLMQYAAVPSLLASILATGVFYGVNLYALNGAVVSLAPYTNPLAVALGIDHSELYVMVLVSLLMVIGCLVLFKTQLGYCLAIYGNNPLFFKHYNISVSYVVIMGLMLSNAAAGLSGYLVAQTSGFVDINAGSGLTLFCITALMLGRSCATSTKVMRVAMPVVGVLLYCFMQQLLLSIGCNIKYFMVIQAVVILLIVCINNAGKQPQQTDHLGV